MTKLNDPANELLDPELELKTYVVTVRTPGNVHLDVEVPTFLGPDAAERRARAVLYMQQGTATPDDYIATNVVEGTFDEPRD